MEQLLSELHRLGIKLSLEGDDLRLVAPPGALTAQIRATLAANKAQLLDWLRGEQAAADALPALEPDPHNRYEPFPLTELQQAYWLGRVSALDMAGVATHLYVELACPGLDLFRANEALCRLIDRHDMLRAVVDGQGMQRILPQVPAYRVATTDCRAASAEEAEAAIDATREALSHQVLQPERWPLFDIRATLLTGEVRLHLSLDLLILDAWSIFLFFREWHRIYASGMAKPAPRISYRDYVLAVRKIEDSPRYRRALAYWEARLDDMPPAPELPLRADPEARRALRFSRREARVDAAKWARLKQRALEAGLTPSGFLLACYGEVLARWSASPHFTINVTIGNRLPLAPEVHELYGDFTSLILHAVDRRDAGASFAEFADKLQRRFLLDIEHSSVSGVTVMREWARRQGASMQATMPVVFSSGLIWGGDQEVGDLEYFGRKVYSVSQTSQVWLDHHVMELKGDLVLIWDAADAVFEAGVLDAMFEAYCGLIERLASEPASWQRSDAVQLPAAMQAQRETDHATAQLLPIERLHASFVHLALAQPQAPALHSPERSLTYGSLLGEACAAADRLRELGTRPGDPVAIVMRKGWQQIVAVMGTLLCGAYYLPIDANLPGRRQRELLQIAGARHVLTHAGGLKPEAEGDGRAVHEIVAGAGAELSATHMASLDGPLDDIAYVIFTSGTTGVPKGVVIDHGGASNTIVAINRRLGAGPHDAVLGVSSLSFDLSVYDIFGVLGAGGALVLPDWRVGHDALHWRELMQRFGVTLWNSAPQLMRMLLDSAEAGSAQDTRLRQVMLSGDFIPLELVPRLRQQFPRAQLLALGGATEASIWSNCYAVRELAPEWTSIPYGKALPNQTLQVLDHALRPTPDHVRGRIHIGGRGLAQGYLGDPGKTASRFFAHPASGERLYDTGDLGRYLPDGNIVILGRDDGQVKIQGHRVELGEIESRLRQATGVREALVTTRSGANDSKQLVAYVVGDGGMSGIDGDALARELGESLPDYMVPRHFVALEALPLNANGKIDHHALPAPGDEAPAGRVPPRNATEQAILDVWSRVIVGLDIGVTDNFFELGGDSVLATQLVRELNASMPARIEMHELFENLTIEALAALYAARPTDESATPAAGTGVLAEAELEADLAALLAQLAALPLAPTQATEGRVLLTGATGWVGAHVLGALLERGVGVSCLVRGSDPATARQRLLDRLAALQLLPADPVAVQDLRVLCGDLERPGFGLAATDWHALCGDIGAIYHFAASVGVLHDYPTLRRTNVAPLLPLLQLATTQHRKRFVTLSPFAVCRRHTPDGLRVLADEAVAQDPGGLLTAYAQTKWVAERLLAAMADRGLAVRIYRCSHALPALATGIAKEEDTYTGVLDLARQAGVVPDWDEALLRGVPADTLGHLIVEDAQGGADPQLVVHIENRTPLSLPQIVDLLLGDGVAPRISVEAWKARCLDLAASLPAARSSLLQVLFARRANGTAVENMFSAHAISTDYFARRQAGERLQGLTPGHYWQRVAARGAEAVQ